MNINIISVGKIKEKYFKDAIDEYLKRLSAYSKVNIIEVSDEKAPENLSQKQLDLVKEKEGERILSKIKDSDYVVTLEILGKQMTSEGFASFLEKERLEGFGRDLDFVIGGSNGLSKKVLARSNFKLSFSKFTFPHKLMRVILLEQIYRAFKILNNEPYHK